MNNETELQMTPRCQRVLDDAAERAREMNHGYIGVEHLFLAIIRDIQAVPTQVLDDISDLSRLESRLLEVMHSVAYSTPTQMVRGLPYGEDPNSS